MTQNPTGAVEGAPRVILRLEGAFLLLAMALAFHWLTTLPGGPSWVLFGVLLLAPDISMLGYLAGPRLGAVVYNAAHTTLVPILLGLAGSISGVQILTALAVIWGAHIGLDRALGYGLKYPGAFRNTHLGRLNPGRKTTP